MSLREFALIDSELPSHRLTGPQASNRVTATLVLVCCSLYLLETFSNTESLISSVEAIERLGGLPSGNDSIQYSPVFELLRSAWWLAWLVGCYIGLPWLFVRYVTKEPFATMGWRWGDTSEHAKGYALLGAPLVLGALIASFSDSFGSYYPMYRSAGRSWVDLFCWESIYLLQFVAVEFFFRGFIITSLRPALGSGAILVMSVPYLMIHFQKPALEALVAFCFGIVASVLALRSGSIWGGVIIHGAVAVAMDVSALTQRSALPQQLFPLL